MPCPVKQNAITLLPAASSLLALRRYASASRVPEPSVGVGDPVLTGNDACPAIEVPKTCAAQPPTDPGTHGALGTTTIVRSRQTGLHTLSQLCPLLDTAYEQRCVAQILGADPHRLLLRKNANEAAIKASSESGDLGRYHVMHFATHDLLANDGLLTASEIAQLKLNADWVILSACNTAGSGAPGGEALSGLTLAFFYAGAGSTLISHWPVNSSAAVKLTAPVFTVLQSQPDLGRAEAVRRSMVQIIVRGDDWEAHPAFWAPYVVVGEGSYSSEALRTLSSNGPRARITDMQRRERRRNRKRKLNGTSNTG